MQNLLTDRPGPIAGTASPPAARDLSPCHPIGSDETVRTARLSDALKPILVAGAVLAVIGAAAAPAMAVPVSIEFTGTVESLTTFGTPGAPLLESAFAIGDAVSGALIYDDALAPNSTFDSGPGSGAVFIGAPFALTVTMGARTYSATGGNVFVRDDGMAGSSAPVADSAIFSGVAAVSGPQIGGQSAERVQFSLGSGVLSALADTALPDLDALLGLAAVNGDGLPPGNFNAGTNFVSFENNETARFRIDDVTAGPTPAPIPLPGGAVFAATAVGALAAASFGSRRRRATGAPGRRGPALRAH